MLTSSRADGFEGTAQSAPDGLGCQGLLEDLGTKAIGASTGVVQRLVCGAADVERDVGSGRRAGDRRKIRGLKPVRVYFACVINVRYICMRRGPVWLAVVQTG